MEASLFGSGRYFLFRLGALFGGGVFGATLGLLVLLSTCAEAPSFGSEGRFLLQLGGFLAPLLNGIPQIHL